jgi:hypothetical protein
MLLGAIAKIRRRQNYFVIFALAMATFIFYIIMRYIFFG